jgi:hypothetical protein
MELSQSGLALKSNTNFAKFLLLSQMSHVDGMKKRLTRNPKIPSFNTVGTNHAYKSSGSNTGQAEIENITVLLIAVN